MRLSPLASEPRSETYRPTPDPTHVRNRSTSCLSGPEDVARSHEGLSVSPNVPSPQMDLPPEKKRRIETSSDSSRIELNLNRYGRGIFNTPDSHVRTTKPAAIPVSALELPPKRVADGLLRQYNSNLHSIFPVLHWPSFQKQYDAVYAQQSLSDVPHIWAGLLFSVFAIGSLQETAGESQKYLEISISQVDLMIENFNLDHARVALLISICLTERNRKAAGSLWLGIASRIAYDLGLHCSRDTFSPWEAEMRRRVWWSIYAWEL